MRSSASRRRRGPSPPRSSTAPRPWSSAPCALTGDPVQDEEDLHAAACAAYIVLLAGHARGLATYWRTPEVLRTPGGRQAVGMPEDERFVGLIHLGTAVQEQRPPERAPADQVIEFLE